MNSRIMTTIRTPKPVHTPSRVSRRAQRACAAFGLMVHAQSPQTHPYAITPTDEQLDAITTAPIALIHGPSGSGKSRRLTGIDRELQSKGHRVHRVQPIADPSQATFDTLDGTTHDVCTSLAMAGLGEPRLWAMPIASLSTGERARIELCAAMHHACKDDFVICDEFCTPLDRVCAASVCATVHRWAHRKGVHFIAASAHEDLADMLGPDTLIDGSTGELTAGAGEPRIDRIRYETGTIAHYDQLAHLHYLGGRPATWTRIIRAIRTSPVVGEMLAGVLVVSMPTLNSAWRKQAWGDRYSNRDKRLSANRINTELRCLSRVIVQPASRGLGIASGLVRAYLDNPQTPATEAIAAMGAVCPFFARSGMREYQIATPTPNARLLDALHYLNTSAADLAHTNIEQGSLLHRELMHWARSTRMLRDEHTPVRAIALMAACRLLSQPRAYAWRKNGEHDEHRKPSP